VGYFDVTESEVYLYPRIYGFGLSTNKFKSFECENAAERFDPAAPLIIYFDFYFIV
jgi:hypothetical protein